MHCAGDLVMCFGDLNGHVGRIFFLISWRVWHRSEDFGRKNFIRVLSGEGNMCTWFKREEKRKVTFRMGENETEIDFVSIKNEH